MRKIMKWAASLAALVAFQEPLWAGDFQASYQRIPSWDGIELGAYVLTPQDQGPGPFPLIVMPSGWATPDLIYVGRSTELASRGYVVVSFTDRGFWDSEGLVDIDGPATVKDVSSVIDWALGHTPVDPGAIGISGISSGGVISLLAAERDPRIKVVATASVWGDLKEALYANQTTSAQATAALVALDVATSRPGPLVAAVNAKVLQGDFDGAAELVLPVAPERSPINGVSALNERGTPVLLANSFSDSIDAPGSAVDFYERILGPKQMLLSQGEHVVTELPGSLGLPNDVYTAIGRWFDRYLKGIGNGVEREPSVKLRSQDGVWHGYADWQAIQAGATRHNLGKPGGLVATGDLAGSAQGGWDWSIQTAVPTLANSGVAVVSGILQEVGVAPQAKIPWILRSGAAVWQTSVSGRAQRLDGFPKLHITVTPSQAATTVYAYLYSVDPLGNGQLISHKPYSLRNVRPGAPQALDLRLEPQSWNIPAGNRLALVVGTVDLRYAGLAQPGGTLTFSSPQQDPSYLSVPLR